MKNTESDAPALQDLPGRQTMVFIEPTAGRGAPDEWSSIDWPTVERSVRRLQERIFRATASMRR